MYPLKDYIVIRAGFAALALTCALVARADRFIVPVPSNDSSSSSAPSAPPPAPSSPSSGSDYSGSGSSSGPSSSSSPHEYTRSNSGRFIVPVPRGGSVGPGNGGPWGGPHHNHPYWGGYYYSGGGYYCWGGRYYWPTSDLWDPFVTIQMRRYSNQDDSNETFFYYPPVPPPLGAPLPPPPPALSSRAAPAELARYVNEPFYAPLASRLAKRNLSAKLRERIDGYGRQKAAQVEKLRDFLDSLEALPASQRAEEMEAFSAQQTPTLVQLEATAEQIRVELLHRSLRDAFVGESDWNDARSWRLGENVTRYATPDLALDFEFRVMRAAAFFQDGLSPAQRRLLREIAMELQAVALTPQTQSATNPDENLLFFQPATARIKLPQNLPGELADKIDLYRKEKAAIKAKLRQTIFDLDRQSASTRASALRKLAQEQQPRIDDLNTIAEEIRQGLAANPEINSVATPEFPPELAARISAYAKAKRAYQTDWQTRIAETSPLSQPDKTGPALHDASVGSTLRERWQSLNREFAPRRQELERQKETIRSEIAAWAASRPPSEPRKSIEDLLKDFASAQARQESWHIYDDYRRAVLLPGLSPEQRRLLFDGALEKLALPLPSGEAFPWL